MKKLLMSSIAAGGLMAVALVLAFAARGGAERVAAAVPAKAGIVKTTTTTCDTPTPTSADDYAANWDSIPRTAWAGADQSVSVRLAGGSVLWLFADTTTTQADGHTLATFTHSSAFVQQYGCFTRTMAPNGNGIFPNDADGSYYWPSQVVQLPTGTILASVSKVQKTGSGDFGFTVVGQRAATLTIDANNIVHFGRWLNYWPSSTSIHWGAGMAVDGSTLRIWGTQVGGPYNLYRALYTASVPTGAIEFSSSWTLGTSPVVSQMSTVGDSANVYRDAGGEWHVITKNVFSDSVYDYHGMNANGPYTATSVLSGLDNTLSPNAYSPAIHAGLTLASGKLLLTVCHNASGDTDFGDDHYRPTFHEVTLP